MNPFISTADLEAVLGTALADPTALIVKIALDSACESVRSYMGQVVNLVEDDVEVHSGRSRVYLRLRERPVRAVTQLVVDDEVVDPADYALRDSIITMVDGSAFPYGYDNIEVTYDHGWDLAEPSGDNVPADIRLVALSVAKRVYMSVGTKPQGVISETIGDYGYQLAQSAVVRSASELLLPEQAVLDRYAVRLVP